MLKTIFFDIGGTLIHPDMGLLMSPLLARLQPSPQQLAAADRAAKHAGRDGAAASSRPGAPGYAPNRGHWSLYFETLLRVTGAGEDLLPELTARAGDSSYWTLVDPDAAATLEELRLRYRLAVISNADGKIRAVLERGGLARYFEAIVDSGCVGVEKPDRRIFQAGLQAMQAEARESLYVGDIYGIDFCGATAAGMCALLLDPDEVYAGWDAQRIARLKELPGWLESQPAQIETQAAVPGSKS